MKIRDIQIEGFGVWSGLNVDSMPDTMTVFYGPNEAGKTTLMQFLRSMFYGYTQERRTRYLPPVHGGRPGGVIRVTGPGGGYEVSRRAQLDENSVQGQLTVASSDGMVQGQHRLAMLLGQVDETIFTNVFAIGLRELQELNTLDDTAAADELYKLSSGMDRVSLVDVIRQLRNARSQIVSPSIDQGQMQALLAKREKLRDEMEDQSGKARRWAELAAVRRNQQQEVDELRERIEKWELESKSTEIAIQVREPWGKRLRLEERREELGARMELDESSETKLKELLDKIAERQISLEEVKQSRKALRDRARNLPVRKSILEVSAKIEAANEQAPWIATLQKQIQQLESDVETAREELVEDGRRLGLSDQDQEALLLDKRLANIPDLSTQALGQLAEPARDVRVSSLKLKQAKQQGSNDKSEAARLQAELSDFLSERGQEDLHAAISKQNDFITKLREFEQLNDRVEKLAKHKRELESEAVDLAAEEALPIERAVILSIPFLFGGCLLLIGMAKSFNWWFEQDQTTGMLMSLIGIIVLFVYQMWRGTMERGSNTDLIECEDQLESVIKQHKKAEHDRDVVERQLPAFEGSISQRIVIAERDLNAFEELLPIHHNRQAALQRYQSARKRGLAAAKEMKIAKSKWRKTLQSLGLADSLSPKSIRILAEGYESLMQSRSRLRTFEDQLNQRKLELSTISSRIETLARQVYAAIREDQVDSVEAREFIKQKFKDSDRTESSPTAKLQNHKSASAANSLRLIAEHAEKASEEDLTPVARLQSLAALLTEQQTFIQKRREFKEEDEQFAKQQKSIERSIEKTTIAKNAMLADLGVESLEHLSSLLGKKRQYLDYDKQILEQTERIQAIIGGIVAYDSVAAQLTNGNGSELDRRFEGLQERIEQAEQRVSQLLTRQGETSQEMRSLASDRRMSAVKLEIACIDKQLDKCSEHWRTLAATTHMLEKVCEVYENERQPETLREASSFLKKLTSGKYVRVWTPLGKNALRIDNEQGQSLPLEVLSRGTREAVFIALRLSLAAAYSRRGVMLPLVMDDVLVNFDARRALAAAEVLREFAELGHQVIMFTCHEHIMKMFHSIGVQVRVLPKQGVAGEAYIYEPAFEPAFEPAPEPLPVPETVYVDEPEPILEFEPDPIPEVMPEPVLPDPVVIDEPRPKKPSVPDFVGPPKPIFITVEREPAPVPATVPDPPKKRKRPRPAPLPIVERPAAAPEPVETVLTEIDHLWYELDPNRQTAMDDLESYELVRATEFTPFDSDYEPLIDRDVRAEATGKDNAGLWWENVGSY